MSFGSLIEAAFGLVAIYLALSIIVTAVNEGIASWVRLRADTLRRAIDGMVTEDGRKRLYDSPLVRALGIADAGDEPRWIPGDLFAGLAVEGWLEAAKAEEQSLDSVEAVVERIDAGQPVPAAVEAMAALLRQGATTAEELAVATEEWFDAVMGAASAAYGARMRVYGVVVGLVVCLALNADTVEFVEAVWTDDAVQAAVTQWAEEQLAAGEPTTVTPELVQAIPLGWSQADVCEATGLACVAPAEWGGVGAALSKLLGLLASALAVSLGAPFWFEVLSNLDNLRKKSGSKSGS